MHRDIDPNDPSNRLQDHKFVGDRFEEYCLNKLPLLSRVNVHRIITGPRVLFTTSTSEWQRNDKSDLTSSRTYFVPTPDVSDFMAAETFYFSKDTGSMGFWVMDEGQLIKRSGGSGFSFRHPEYDDGEFDPKIFVNILNEFMALSLTYKVDQWDGELERLSVEFSPTKYSFNHNSVTLFRERHPSSPNELREPNHLPGYATVNGKRRSRWPMATHDIGSVRDDNSFALSVKYLGEQCIGIRIPIHLDLEELVSGLASRELLNNMLTDDLSMDAGWRYLNVSKELGIEAITPPDLSSFNKAIDLLRDEGDKEDPSDN